LGQGYPKNNDNQRSNPGNPENWSYAGELDASDPIAWPALFALRAAYRQRTANRTRSEAEILAYADSLLRWHCQHGAQPPTNRCVGCGEALINKDALDLGQGIQVHLDGRLSCLMRYGHSWRSAAVAGLGALGLDPPPGFELL
jgi:hypothetical protein